MRNKQTDYNDILISKADTFALVVPYFSFSLHSVLLKEEPISTLNIYLCIEMTFSNIHHKIQIYSKSKYGSSYKNV